MDKTIHRNCACIQPPFASYRNQFTGKPSAPLPFERSGNSGVEATLRFYIDFEFLHDFCF